MARVSAALIVKNEEETLPNLLPDLVRLVDEIVIVDTGSTDGTRQVAMAFDSQRCPIRIVDFEWVNDFSAARNHALEQCVHEWILVLDADDVIPDPKAFRKAIEALDTFDADAVVMPYRVWKIDTMNPRFFRRRANLRFQFRVHESIMLPEKIVVIPDVWVKHNREPEENQGAVAGDKYLAMMQSIYDSGDRSAHICFYLARDLQANGVGNCFKVWRDYFAPLERPGKNFEYTALLLFAEELDRLAPFSNLGHKERVKAIDLEPTRAEAWCEIGRHLQQAGRWAEAIVYYQGALGCRRPALGFVINDDYTWAPHDGLMYCHTQLGETEIALYHAREALARGADPDVMNKNIEELDRITRSKIATPV